LTDYISVTTAHSHAHYQKLICQAATGNANEHPHRNIRNASPKASVSATFNPEYGFAAKIELGNHAVQIHFYD